MFLKKEEIFEMTGLKRATLQIEFLRSKGYTVETDNRGYPKVLRSHVEAMLGGNNGNPRRRAIFEPDLQGLREMSIGHAKN